MIAEIFGGISFFGIGALVTRHLNGRINRVEDKSNEHFTCLDKKVSQQGEDIAVIKAVVERIEKRLTP